MVVRLYRLPYNWKLPVPYFFTMMAQFFAFSHVASIYLLPFIIFFGICFNLVMFAKDVEQNITKLGDLMRQYTECVSMDRAQELSLDMKIMLQKLIQFHGEAKKLRISCNLSYVCVKFLANYLGKLFWICSFFLCKHFLGAQRMAKESSEAYMASTTCLLFNSMLFCCIILLQMHQANTF